MQYEKEKFIKKIRQIPLFVPIIILFICVYGFILLYSAANKNIELWAYKQMVVYAIFMPISLIITLLDLRLIYRFSYLFYAFTVILLVIVELMGKSAMGATRWIDLGIFTIQPSELVKISVVLMLARYFHESDKYNLNTTTIIVPITASLIAIALIIKQPDLGTGIITLIVIVTIFFIAGARLLYFIISGILGFIALPLIWLMLHEYQRNRIFTFLDPEKDPLGSGYNIIQSKIAIGSGGLFGKGLFNGTQSHLNFLPEYQTDFIFSFLTEELGFVGGIFLIFLYALLIINSLYVAISCKSKFLQIMTIGMITVFFCHIFINIAMVMGLLPVVGVPLPFISYGRTMMVSMLIGFGLIMNATINKRSNI